MKDIYIFLTTGFEEIEALATVDILRRAGLPVKTVSLTGERRVEGSHSIPVTADMMFPEINPAQTSMLIIPGGTVRFNEHEGLKVLLADFAARGGRIAAICAAPMVLGGLGLLKGKKATCYPGFEKYLDGAILTTDAAVVTDGQITTGKGPGLALEFALELVRLLEPEKAEKVKTDLCL